MGLRANYGRQLARVPTAVAIQGSAVVGQALSATFEAAGDPPTKIEYRISRVLTVFRQPIVDPPPKVSSMAEGALWGRSGPIANAACGRNGQRLATGKAAYNADDLLLLTMSALAGSTRLRCGVRAEVRGRPCRRRGR
jgi:hypothetical protein